ncbi:MAG: choice-of-anchor D domain-containing protein, partial [Acidobacteriaceae bacterium]
MRRYLLYLGLLAGFCVLLVAGCGSITPIGELKATESTVSFGAVTVGQTSTATVTFMNGGASAVQITQVNVTGQAFKLASVGSFPVTVAAGSTYSIPVLFKPSSAGEATGELTLTSTADAGGLPMATLNGLGVKAASPPPQTSGELSGISCNSSSMTGAGTDSCFVALNAPAGSSGVTVNLTSSSPAVTVPASVTVPANTTGAGFTVSVAAVGTSQTGVLTATEGGISEAFALNLTAALRILSTSAANVSFGNVQVNTAATQSVLLTSAGTEAVTIDAATLKGSGFSMSGLAAPATLN